MKPLTFVAALSLAATIAPMSAEPIPSDVKPSVIVDTKSEPIAPGPYAPTWDSLSGYQAPQWFRDAKFGIWAHWGPQCQPEEGDWYARHMYLPGDRQYNSHLGKYGHPSDSGFKEVIREWKAQKWNPEKLVDLYKRTGAQYFFAMANHHDNLDLWDSKYQPWNSVRVGPKKDLIAGWAAAAKKSGLPFGVSVHAAHAWSWYEPAQGSDKEGPKEGVPYDGKLTKEDGKGEWWDGLDPQDLYEQRHSPAKDFEKSSSIHGRWNWGGGISAPDQAYCEKFYNRTVDLINRYHPDLIYFDDTALPLWPVSDAGLKIAAHFYNSNLRLHPGAPTAVIFGKILTDDQKKALVWDVERGTPSGLQQLPWQTDTCLGGWHYDRGVYERDGYKKPENVIRTLVDIVSKNGNLLLNVPVRGDGSIDEKEERVLEGIAAWMATNKESIYGTRPWKIFGEGPASDGAPISAQGFNEGKGKPFTAEDLRYVTKGDKTLYVTSLGAPGGDVHAKSLGKSARLLDKRIAKIEQLGSGPVPWEQGDDALVIHPAAPANSPAVVYKITLE